MAFLRSLAPASTLLDVLAARADTAAPLIEYHERLLRGASPLAPGERELIAAFVSALNGCGYCHGVHEATARAFGLPAGLVEALVADLESAPVDARLRAILRYVGKLTLAPARITEADARAVFDAGWDDRALHDAVSVCALFNMMNRLVEGLGVRAGGAYLAMAGERLHRGGYAGLARLIEERAAGGDSSAVE